MLFKKLIRNIVLNLFLLGSPAFVFSQYDYVQDTGRVKNAEDKMRFSDRLFWGGNLGAWFGNPTFVDVSPLVGIQITKKFSMGVGAIYNYYSYKYNNYKYSTSLYGGRIYARYFILENVFAQAGWDRINRDDPFSKVPNTRMWVDNLLIGGGLRYPISDNFYAIASGFWNLNQSVYSPYSNPIIQIGFIGGF